MSRPVPVEMAPADMAYWLRWYEKQLEMDLARVESTRSQIDYWRNAIVKRMSSLTEGDDE